MAKTFFPFDTSLNNGDLLGDFETRNEEEYDARNDETFGDDLPFSDEDWEQQHEEFAENEENSKLSEDIENSLSQLVLDDTDSFAGKHDSIWSDKSKNGDGFGSPLLFSLRQKVSDSLMDGFNNISNTPTSSVLSPLQQQPPVSLQSKQICTVEELERNLLKTKQQQLQQQQQQQQQKPAFQQPFPHVAHQPYHHIFPPHLPNRPPPGLHHPMPPPPPPHLAHMQHPPPHHMPLRMMPPPPPPHFMPPGGGRPFPPGLMHPNNGQFPVNHPFNFPPPRNMMMNNKQMPPRNFGQPPPPQQQQFQQQQQQQQQQQRIRHDSGDGFKHRNNVGDHNRDEYAGLMTNREKQWLLNIQLLQLNTGTPYFDDYYYTMYKERKANKKPINQKPDRFQQQQRRNNQTTDNQNILTPRVYTPLQFENSLGKLQCGSVTAPRKIIDMDIVTPDKDSDNASAIPRDTRKSKQMLLELETLYTLFLKAIDLKHPLALYDMEKLRELKQKQRFKEMDAAPTMEQKQEVLAVIMEENEKREGDQNEYFMKVVRGLLQEEKFNSFFNFNKGKTLVLRLLPYLVGDLFAVQVKELWLRVLLSLPIIGKRDTLGDNVLPRFYPFFKRHVESYTLGDILEVTNNFTEIIKQDNVRSTPISIRGKPRLHFILTNKFGLSAVSALIARCEQHLQKQQFSTPDDQKKWTEFLTNTADVLAQQKDVVPAPEERLEKTLLQQHLNRFTTTTLSQENKSMLESVFAE